MLSTGTLSRRFHVEVSKVTLLMTGIALSKGPTRPVKYSGALPVDALKARRLKPEIAREVAESILRWFAATRAAVAKYILRSRNSASSMKLVTCDDDQAGIVAKTYDEAIATTNRSFTTPITADAKLDPVGAIAIDQAEIHRRRDLVRKLFNDFWNGAHEKPTAFSERLDQAEDYLNARLAANGEIWQLDDTTRALLGLPARLN
jgi:hypothetical protein